MARYRFDNNALLKVLLHGAKFASSSINGLLIGRSEEESVHVVDAIPLFHTLLTLSPQVEVEERLKENGEEIVGAYVSDAHMSRDDFDSATKTVANKIAAVTSSRSTLALILESSTLHAMMQGDDTLPFRLYSRVSGARNEEWSASDFESSGVGGIKPLFVDMLNRELHKQLHDFDEHLDDIHIIDLRPLKVDVTSPFMSRNLVDCRVCTMASRPELLALSSYLASSSSGCLFLVSVTLTVINFALLCSSRARKQSLQLLVATGNLLLLSFLALAVLGLPFGFLYLAFQGSLWLTSSLADTLPALKGLQNTITRTFF